MTVCEDLSLVESYLKVVESITVDDLEETTLDRVFKSEQCSNLNSGT